MRRKKQPHLSLAPQPAASPTATPSPQSTKADPRDYATSQALEGIIGKVLDPSNALAPEQLHDVMEMFLTALHLRKVGGEFWVETCNQVMDVARCAVEVSTVHQIRASLKLDEKQDKVLAEVINLTIQESAEMRRALIPVINMLQQMPCPWETLH